jgi:alpha-tubulin suppressor-like RCC1 family protein
VAIAAGWDVSLALKRDGSVWEWGSDDVVNYGSVPVQVAGLRGVTAIAMGVHFAFAVQSDGAAGGTLWAWGSNPFGQLGDGTTTNRASPVAIAEDVKSAAGGDWHAYAVKTDGTALAWGLNGYYQLGDGTQAPRSRPAPIPGLSGIAGMTAGSASGSAVRTDGSVLGWASNAYGQLVTRRAQTGRRRCPLSSSRPCPWPGTAPRITVPP